MKGNRKVILEWFCSVRQLPKSDGKECLQKFWNFETCTKRTTKKILLYFPCPEKNSSEFFLFFAIVHVCTIVPMMNDVNYIIDKLYELSNLWKRLV